MLWSANLAEDYADVTPRLARGAAVALLGPGGDFFVPSRDIHYRSRHSFCGPNIPFFFTNTSEPVASDMQHQAEAPIDFDWLVRGVCGLRAVPELMKMVRAKEPFGTYLALLDLPELPSVAVEEAAFLAAAAAFPEDQPIHRALRAAAAVLAENGNRWSRAVEDALYAGYGSKHLTTN